MAKKRQDPLYKSYRDAPELRPSLRTVDTFVEQRTPLSAGGDMLQLGKALKDIQPELNAYFLDKEQEEYKKRLAQGEKLEKELGQQRTYETFVKEHPEHANLHPDVIEGFTRSLARNKVSEYNDFLYNALPTATIEVDGEQKTLAQLKDPKDTDKLIDTIRKQFIGDSLGAIDEVILSEELFPNMERTERTILGAMAEQRRQNFLSVTKEQFGQNVANIIHNAMENTSWDTDNETATMSIATEIRNVAQELHKAGFTYAEANDHLADTLIQVAEITGDPDVLDIANKVETSKGAFMGNTPKYRDMFEKARQNIVLNKLRMEKAEWDGILLEREKNLSVIAQRHINSGIRNLSQAQIEELTKLAGPDGAMKMIGWLQQRVAGDIQNRNNVMSAYNFRVFQTQTALGEDGLNSQARWSKRFTDALMGKGTFDTLEVTRAWSKGEMDDDLATRMLGAIPKLAEGPAIPSTVRSNIDTYVYTSPVVQKYIDPQTGEAKLDGNQEIYNAIWAHRNNFVTAVHTFIENNPSAKEYEIDAFALEMHNKLTRNFEERIKAMELANAGGTTDPTTLAQIGEEAVEKKAKKEGPAPVEIKTTPLNINPQTQSIFSNDLRLLKQYNEEFVTAKAKGLDTSTTYIGRVAAAWGMTPEQVMAAQADLHPLPEATRQEMKYLDSTYTDAIGQLLRNLEGARWDRNMAKQLSETFIDPLYSSATLDPAFKPVLDVAKTFLTKGTISTKDLQTLNVPEETYQKIYQALKLGQINRAFPLLLGAFYDYPARRPKPNNKK
jgi:hypothetical protein